jgi:3-phenylpropionate/trans-cinnamate dioxygenase ferredoxin reductase subunit
MPTRVVIVGGGIAAAKAAEQLRQSGFAGDVTLFAAEQQEPYERPTLSKGYLLGKDDLESAFPHPDRWYTEHGVELRTGDAATAIDRADRVVVSAHGSAHYDRLLLATGAAPRPLPFATEGARVAYLRTVEDSQYLKARLPSVNRVAVVGGGWIGLEVAAAARRYGTRVSLVCPYPVPLMNVLGPEIGTVLAHLHLRHGVAIHGGARAVAVSHDARGANLRLSNGDSVAVDLVVAAIGVQPETGLAKGAHLQVENGIVVDATLATDDPRIFAAGDVANAMHPILGERIRSEHWDNAIQQGKLAARNILGERAVYDRMPYFFTDQYELGLEFVGYIPQDGYERVIVRGDTDALKFTAFWLRGEHVLAAMHVNEWDVIDDLRRLVGNRVDPRALGESTTRLAELTPS